MTPAQRFKDASHHVLRAMEVLFPMDDEAPQQELLAEMRKLRSRLMEAQETAASAGPVPPIRKLPCGCCTNGCVCSHHNPALNGKLIPCSLHAEKETPTAAAPCARCGLSIAPGTTHEQFGATNCVIKPSEAHP